MRTNFDFSPYRRSTVGFDRLFDLLESGNNWQSGENYPPFDLERRSDDEYRITLAVAGFGSDEIDIVAQQNLLIVSGRKRDDDERDYIHRGIATRAFERRFGLADYVQVKNAELRDGILAIDLVREIPEEMKPRKVAINGGGGVEQIDASASEDRQSGNDNSESSQAA
ncbi:Hsp20 family protein [Allosphingosinicella sp.]|uniref:Hsp20 family protein n=1 Tax=Allosphingosinicella sp. TaxID=2823234 RepID=UPI002EE4BC62